MWWEAIPSLAVIIVSMGMLPMVVYGANKIQFGNAYRREIYYIADAQFFLRDERISGKNNAYIQKGLENIPDGEAESTSKADACVC